MASNGGQYDPRAQAMEEVHFDWRCIVCCMVALSPVHLEQQHLPGTESVYFDLDHTPWVKCDKCHTPFIYSVGPGNQFMLLDPDVFFAPSSVVDSSNYHPPFLFCLICLFFLKMGRKPYCPDGGKDKSKKKKKKDTDTDQTKRNTTDQKKKPTTSPGGGSAHKDQSTGNFTADVMAACIEEIKRVEAEAAAKGEQPKLSRNKICRSYGLAPGTVSKRMTGKVTGLGPQGGGVRRGRIFTAG